MEVGPSDPHLTMNCGGNDIEMTSETGYEKVI